jgi:hypothetical protein
LRVVLVKYSQMHGHIMSQIKGIRNKRGETCLPKQMDTCPIDKCPTLHSIKIAAAQGHGR